MGGSQKMNPGISRERPPRAMKFDVEDMWLIINTFIRDLKP
jgi:hypothetical protein